MKSLLLSLVSIMSLINLTTAQTGKYSNEFMAIGVGARAQGMSGSNITSVYDITSGYWNPAGLTGINSNIQLGAMHSEYFAGIAKYDYGAIGFKIDTASAMAVSMVRFGVDGIPNTTELIDNEGQINYDRITTFSAVDYGFLLSYGRKMKIPGLKIGVNAKVIHRKVGDMAKAWGFGLDAGVQYTYKGWQTAIMARDITTTFNAWSYSFSDRMQEVWALTGNEIPKNSVEVTLPRIILGVAKKHHFKYGFSFLGELNIDVTTDGKRNVLLKGKPLSGDPHAGFEIGYRELVFVRAGIGNFQYELSDFAERKELTFQPNAGLGIKIKSLAIDYAFSDLANQSVALYSHIVSLKLDIHKKK